MAEGEIVAEVWAALRTDVTRHADSCFVSNLAIPELGRHGGRLPPAAEAVVSSPELEQARQAEPVVGRNLLHLLLVYFEQADQSGWDSARFLRSLRSPLLHEALVAVFQIWGPTRGVHRRRVMPRPLYEAWHALIAQDPDWAGEPEGLSRYISAGLLSLVSGPAEPPLHPTGPAGNLSAGPSSPRRPGG